MSHFSFRLGWVCVFLAAFVFLNVRLCRADDPSVENKKMQPDVFLTFSPAKAADSQIVNDLAAHPDVQNAVDGFAKALTKKYIGPFDDEENVPPMRIMFSNLVQNLFETDKLPLKQWGHAVAKPARMTQLVQFEFFLEKTLQNRAETPLYRLTTVTKYNPEKLTPLLLFLKEGVDYEKTRNDGEVVIYRFDLSRYDETEEGGGESVFYLGGRKIGDDSFYLLVISHDLPLLESKLAEAIEPAFAEEYIGPNGPICEIRFERRFFELTLFDQTMQLLSGEAEPNLWQQNFVQAIDNVRHFSVTTRDSHEQTVTDVRLDVNSTTVARELADVAQGLKTLFGFGKHVILDDETEFAREIMLGLTEPMTVLCEDKTVTMSFEWTHFRFQKLARYGVITFLENAKDYDLAGQLNLQFLFNEGDGGNFKFNLHFNADPPDDENDDTPNPRQNEKGRATDVREA